MRRTRAREGSIISQGAFFREQRSCSSNATFPSLPPPPPPLRVRIQASFLLSRSTRLHPGLDSSKPLVAQERREGKGEKRGGREKQHKTSLASLVFASPLNHSPLHSTLASHAPASPRQYQRLTNVENRLGQINVSKVTRTVLHVLAACLALEVAIDGPHLGVHQPALAGAPRDLVDDLWELDESDRVGFLLVELRQQQDVEVQRRGVGEATRTISSGERIPNWISRI